MTNQCIAGACLGSTGFSYTLSLINGKYKMNILYALMEFQVVRFNEMKKYIGTISYKTLSSSLKELEADYARLEELISSINRTNNSTKLEDGTTLSDLLARRDCLKGRLSALRNFLSNASTLVRRHSASEIKVKSTVNVRQLQKQVDSLSKELRELEETIQEKNWTTELL